jgi:hypothetical protein
MQIRQAFTGVSVFAKQSVGVSTPAALHASSSDAPSATVMLRPSTVSSI